MKNNKLFINKLKYYLSRKYSPSVKMMCGLHTQFLISPCIQILPGTMKCECNNLLKVETYYTEIFSCG